MSFRQIAVAGQDCYQLLTDGTVKQYNATSATWEVIDQQEDNVEIVGGTYVGLRRESGHAYKFNRRYWEHLHTGVTRLWGWKDRFWLRKEGSSILWYKGPETHGEWKIRSYYFLTKDLIMVQNNIYQLAENGQISSYCSPEGWTFIDPSTDAIAIATDNNNLFKLQKNGFIYRFKGQENWQLVGSEKNIVEIAGGIAGLFTRHRDGTVYKFLGDLSWQVSDVNTDNVHLAVAASAYRVNDKGEIHRLEATGAWTLLEDNPVVPPEERRTPTGVEPKYTYDGPYNNRSSTLLRIASGAAGQNGLVGALGDAFIKFRVSKGFDVCKVAWCESNTSNSLNYLNDGTVDAAITCSPPAAAAAIDEGIALDPVHYIFREHLLLVGPPSNPANLNPNSDITTMFSTIYRAAVAGNTYPSVLFSHRRDRSTTNLIESTLWKKVNQGPMEINPFPEHINSSSDERDACDASLALHAAANWQQYTLTEYSTYCLNTVHHDRLAIYKRGQDDDPSDLLFMPGYLLVSARARNPILAEQFAAWAAGPEGQAVVDGFKIYNKHSAYSATLGEG
ncbi:hypothetical protein BO78DRAFT_465909 [Aspergillus sclerotiicarbonarius CBS 121057]|uniref:PBP domain-containing protein n=1 Tax=Aspergillus sclerotiicarbonarius (strain CBS 121057 / IBT 28362) TaxID=1448318 RepID=A0A319ENY8_ASPSB|nr:hypothetical protein BO78DRAFT_465909 [Aspergillus sclerotiicarbonarius CBS 121057]